MAVHCWDAPNERPEAMGSADVHVPCPGMRGTRGLHLMEPLPSLKTGGPRPPAGPSFAPSPQRSPPVWMQDDSSANGFCYLDMAPGHDDQGGTLVSIYGHTERHARVPMVMKARHGTPGNPPCPPGESRVFMEGREPGPNLRMGRSRALSRISPVSPSSGEMRSSSPWRQPVDAVMRLARLPSPAVVTYPMRCDRHRRVPLIGRRPAPFVDQRRTGWL